MRFARGRWVLGRFVSTSVLVVALFVLGATIAYAATGSFNITVPRFGSQTGNQCRATTSGNGRRIETKYSAAPQDSQIKAIRCADGTDIGGFRFVPAGDLSRVVLNSNVIVGTQFKLNIDTPGCCTSATFTGNVYF